VLQTLIALGLSPALVAASTVATMRWGPTVGGVVSAFPAVVGPVLLIDVVGHGRAFAARAADGTLFGLVALAAFAAAYGLAAPRSGWKPSLVAGWMAAGAAAGATGLLTRHAGTPAGPVAAVASLSLAYLALPAVRPAPRRRSNRIQSDLMRRSAHPVLVRVATTSALVIALSLGAGIVGPFIGGMLAALPILASVLCVFAHRESGFEALIRLLRGMLGGMAGFVAFCEIIALAVRNHSTAVAFLAATAGAVTAQLLVCLILARPVAEASATAMTRA
jgi:hypothetical protein